MTTRLRSLRQVRADRRRRRELNSYLVSHPGWPPGGGSIPATYVRPARISRLWAWAPLLSVGMLTFLPFLRIAAARRRSRDWTLFAIYSGVTVVIVTLANIGAPARGALNSAIGAVVFVLIVVATTHALIELRSLPRPLHAATPGQPFVPQPDPVQLARARIGRRAEARKLARRDPVLARELRIGRPDLPRQYDDGGLVDVNNVPDIVLAQHLQLTPQEIQAVVAARGQLGNFTSAEEVSVYAQLAPARVDAIRDLLWFG